MYVQDTINTGLQTPVNYHCWKNCWAFACNLRNLLPQAATETYSLGRLLEKLYTSYEHWNCFSELKFTWIRKLNATKLEIKLPGLLLLLTSILKTIPSWAEKGISFPAPLIKCLLPDKGGFTVFWTLHCCQLQRHPTWWAVFLLHCKQPYSSDFAKPQTIGQVLDITVHPLS